MKLRILKGDLDVEIVEGSMSIEDVRSMLGKMAKADDEESVKKVREAGEKTSSEGLTSKSTQIGKLGAKPKLPI